MRATHLISDRILFGFHPFSVFLQKGVQRVLRGPREVEFQFTRGPLTGLRFSCWSNQKYFFVREDYERELLDPIASLVKPGMTVFDVGAHFGFWALVLSKLCGPNGRVFAFEPLPGNRDWLCKNLALNSIHNVRVIPMALSERHDAATMSNAGSYSALNRGAVPIQMTTIDAFCANNPVPDLLLVDVEGYAGHVVRGAARTYAKKFIPAICEIHNAGERDAVQTFMGHRPLRTLDHRAFPNRVLVV